MSKTIPDSRARRPYSPATYKAPLVATLNVASFAFRILSSTTHATMTKLASLAVLAAALVGLSSAHPHHHIEGRSTTQLPIGDPKLSINGVPFSTRAHWMRQANLALNAPCPFAAFGAVIVNHTASTGLGTVVCTGANANSGTGNPTHHGTYLP